MMPGSFEERWGSVQERIRAACRRAGRAVEEVTLVAVSKNQPPEAIEAAAACGVTIFGESRVQEAAQKIPLSPGHLEWHFIGHLQRNKLRPAVQLFRVLHAVDSLRLLQSLDQECEEAGARMRVMLEVNVSGEGSKYGFAPADCRRTLELVQGLACVEVTGLMTIPPFTPDPNGARPYFCRLRELRDQWAGETGCLLPELSMGMSNDFEVAIEEGATWIRLGSVLFGPRPARISSRQEVELE